MRKDARIVRPARQADLDALSDLYRRARAFMAENGNPTQWREGHPSRELLEADLAAKQLYVITDGESIQGAFVLLLGEEPSYATLTGGTWGSQAPYGTIHRLAGFGGGIFRQCLDFCLTRIPYLRIDTHADNHIMQHLILSHGFTFRGTVRLSDGTSRLAYDRLPDLS